MNFDINTSKNMQELLKNFDLMERISMRCGIPETQSLSLSFLKKKAFSAFWSRHDKLYQEAPFRSGVTFKCIFFYDMKGRKKNSLIA